MESNNGPIAADEAYRVLEAWWETNKTIRCNSTKSASMMEYFIIFKGTIQSISRERVTILIEQSDNFFQFSLKGCEFERTESDEEVKDYPSYAYHLVAKEPSGRFMMFSEMDPIFPKR